MTPIHLDSPLACLSELEECSNRLAELTQEATRTREALGIIDEQLEQIESMAAEKVGEKGLTATELKGRVTAWILAVPEAAAVREAAHSLRSEAATLDRRLKTLEKRSMAAQSALKAHDSEARNAGHTGGSGI